MQQSSKYSIGCKKACHTLRLHRRFELIIKHHLSLQHIEYPILQVSPSPQPNTTPPLQVSPSPQPCMATPQPQMTTPQDEIQVSPSTTTHPQAGIGKKFLEMFVDRFNTNKVSLSALFVSTMKKSCCCVQVIILLL